MNKVVLCFFLLMSLVVTAFAVYLTVVSRQDVTKKTVPDWVTSHVKTIKIVGPVLIGVGLLGVGTSALSLSHTNSQHSNFGFKFY
jgi:hypothetical protein